MKNLRLYEHDTDFKAVEQAAGGDGNSVKTKIPGVSSIWDVNKTYFNPHDETKLVYTITMNYKDIKGETIAPSETFVVPYYSGVSQEVILYAKHIDEYVINNESETISIPRDNSVDFIYTDANIFEPLTFKIETAGVFTFTWWSYYAGNSGAKTIQYKKNDGPWTNLVSTTWGNRTVVSVSGGDVIKFRGNNQYYATSISDYNTFSGSTCKFSLAGNIMSLIDSTNFATAKALSDSNNFCNLFAGCTGLTSAEKLVLPATALTTYCYYSMFNGCTSLTATPELPATTLVSHCYQGMFFGCTSLTATPELPATTLAEKCYDSMFSECISLTGAPALPATALAEQCYAGMFYNCSNLITAPELPASAIGWGSYYSMFEGCTSLIMAPELPATSIWGYSYYRMFKNCASLTTAPLIAASGFPGNSCCAEMFYNCKSLNYINCLTTYLYGTGVTANWVYNVSPSGTFVKPSSMYNWTRGVNGIPTNWTVVDV